MRSSKWRIPRLWPGDMAAGLTVIEIVQDSQTQAGLRYKVKHPECGSVFEISHCQITDRLRRNDPKRCKYCSNKQQKKAAWMDPMEKIENDACAAITLINRVMPVFGRYTAHD